MSIAVHRSESRSTMPLICHGMGAGVEALQVFEYALQEFNRCLLAWRSGDDGAIGVSVKNSILGCHQSVALLVDA